jgi:hypothetical protein
MRSLLVAIDSTAVACPPSESLCMSNVATHLRYFIPAAAFLRKIANCAYFLRLFGRTDGRSMQAKARRAWGRRASSSRTKRRHVGRMVHPGRLEAQLRATAQPCMRGASPRTTRKPFARNRGPKSRSAYRASRRTGQCAPRPRACSDLAQRPRRTPGPARPVAP